MHSGWYRVLWRNGLCSVMGVSSSHPSCGGGLGGLGGGPHPKHSRANLGATVSAEDLLSANFRGEKKKKRSGLSTLKRKLVGKKKVSESPLSSSRLLC